MINGKYISSKEIVSRVIRDSGVTNIPYSDAIEWVAECLDLIAVPRSYVSKVTQPNDWLEIEGFKAKLPADLVQIKQVAKVGNQVPSKIPNNLIINLDYTTGEQIVVNINEATNCNLVPMRYSGNSFHGGMICDDCVDYDRESDFTYTVNEDYLFTNFKNGFVTMSYLAYPIDCDGFPTIPDNEKFKQAVQWYIQAKVDYIMWRQNKLAGDVYHKSEQERNWYIGAAQTSGLTPTIDEMETWKNMSLRLLPVTNAHDTFFGSVSDAEMLTKSRSTRRFNRF
jgi:hypothetical protein